MAKRSNKPTHSSDVKNSDAGDGQRQLVVAGIGASAGGLDALTCFLNGIRSGSGVAYVVIQHMSPNQPSQLPELLKRACVLPVHAAQDGLAVEPDQVYVIQPNTLLKIRDGRLVIQGPLEGGAAQMPIDLFLTSLAADQEDRAIGVVLSGTGTDGNLGLKAIREYGGYTLAQATPEGKEAEDSFHSGMPQSAIALGVVDEVAQADKLPELISEYREHLATLNTQKGITALHTELQGALEDVFGLLRTRTGHDFRDYKANTIIRRIQRRMQVYRDSSVSDYLDRLRNNNEEIDTLLKELLIGVTYFFRDPEHFEALEREVFESLVSAENKSEIRVWVPGCATGEEVYSIAMAAAEQLSKQSIRPRVQIFGTDIDEKAIRFARAGLFPKSIANELSSDRLTRFFEEETDGFRVSRDIRAICLFSCHDVTRDPPFSRLDLLSCRNLLIYMQPALQKRLLPIFHYALKSGGYLFLGPTETTSQVPGLFTTVDGKHRIFRRSDNVARPPLELSGSWRDHEPSEQTTQRRAERDFSDAAAQRLLESYAPPYVVVNDNHEALRFSGDVGRYLQLPSGAATLNVVNMARRGLRIALRTALHQASKMHQVVTREEVDVRRDGRVDTINLHVEPLGTEDYGPYLVVFEKTASSSTSSSEVAKFQPAERGDRELESELETTRARLQTTIEELESSNEELQSSNEELLSMNEELQSSNEELEASKEELQSLNEELETLNQERAAKVEELSRAYSDLGNILQNTNIGALFLDRNLRVRWFNDAVKNVFRLIQNDPGRPITDIVSHFWEGELETYAREVLQNLTTVEREVAGGESATNVFLMRMSPYRTIDDVIDGVVLLFVDVSELKRVERQLSNVLESIVEAFLAVDHDLRISYFNTAAETLLGRPRETVTGLHIWTAFPDLRATALDRVLQNALDGEDSQLQTQELVDKRLLLLKAAPAEDGASVFLLDLSWTGQET